MPMIYVPQQLCELLLVGVVPNSGKLPKVLEGLHIPVSDLQSKSYEAYWTLKCSIAVVSAGKRMARTYPYDLWLGRQTIRQVLQLSNSVSKPDWQLVVQKLS